MHAAGDSLISDSVMRESINKHTVARTKSATVIFVRACVWMEMQRVNETRAESIFGALAGQGRGEKTTFH
jgi:hypothetical protein